MPDLAAGFGISLTKDSVQNLVRVGLIDPAVLASAGKIFGSTADGIAGTSAGNYFWVAVSGANTMVLYKNVAGVATAQNVEVMTKLGMQASLARVFNNLNYSPSFAFRNGSAGFLFDFTDPATLWADAARTIPAVVNGPVLGFSDLSGQGNHGTGTNTVLKRDENGVLYVYFDATAYISLPSGASIHDATGKATCVAAVRGAQQQVNVIYAEASNSSPNPLYNVLQTGSGRTVGGTVGVTNRTKLRSQIRNSAATNYSAESTLMAFDDTLHVVGFRDDARTVTNFVDGRAQGSFAYAGTITPNTRTIGAVAQAAVSEHYLGRVYGILGVRETLPVAEVKALSDWFANRCRRVGERSIWGAWTIYNDPRGISVDGRPVLSCVSPNAMVPVADLGDRSAYPGARFPLLQFDPPGLVTDDHNNAALVNLSNGKVLAIAPPHAEIPYWVSRSVSAKDVTAWETPIDISASLGTTRHSYANPIRMAALTGVPIYLFYRGLAPGDAGTPTLHTCHMSKCLEANVMTAASWATGVKVLSGTRPYFRVIENGTGRIDFICNDGHPDEQATNNTYHFYMTTDGTTESFFKTDGTPLTLPITPVTHLSKIYDQAAMGQGRSWVYDIAIVSGRPVAVIATFPNVDSDHRYRYLRQKADGSWVSTEICKAGGPISLITASRYYSGGIILDHADPNVVYCSRSVNGGVHQVWRYETEDEGQNWSGRQLTFDREPCFRPYVVRGQVAEPRLAYCTGSYPDYDSYDARVRQVNSLTGLADEPPVAARAA
jgi:hypothetical protein